MNNIHGLNSGGSGRGGARGANGGGGGGYSGTPGCMDQIKAGWVSLPLFNKFIFSTLTACAILSWFTPVVSLCMLAPAHLLTFQVWRLFTGTFVVDGLLSWLFTLFSYIPSAMVEENAMGTVPFAIRFFKLTLFINVVYTVFAIAVGLLLLPGIMRQPSMGLWPVIFCDMVI